MKRENGKTNNKKQKKKKTKKKKHTHKKNNKKKNKKKKTTKKKKKKKKKNKKTKTNRQRVWLTVLCWPTVLSVLGHKSKTHIAQLCPRTFALDQNEKVVTYSYW